ncbi:alpha/beta hydrolase [Rhodococcus gannanensis]|jgi:acetyl esterase/lipase|uniref:Alpha/beta hydrolase n=1 Tax=Rhodococcus gannanensis TaxID=1960308 RepID=A0ABW4P1M3_9NOCA
MRYGENTVWHWDVSARARVVDAVARTVVKPVFSAWPSSDVALRVLAEVNTLAGMLPAPPNTQVARTTLGGVRCDRITHARRATDELDGATILYLHGGGFVFCGTGTHRTLCALLSARSGAPVYSVDYRQVPVGGIGTSIADAMSAYRALLDTCVDPTKIIVAGDSAGGYLAMKVAEIAALQGLPRPAAVLGYSPLLNLHLDRHDPQFMRRDAFLPMNQVAALKERWLDGPDDIVGVHNPVDADPSLLPPVFLTSAEHELMRPDVELLTARLEKAGRHVETHLWTGQIHAFPVLGAFLREARELVSLSVDFARRSVGEQVRRTA